jgi:hypothetical protein
MASWTWAMEAAATGVSSKSEKTLSRGRPSSAEIISLAAVAGKGGTSSRSFLNSSAYSSVMRSGLEESIWANFMKVGPSSSKASLSLSGRVGPLASGHWPRALILFRKGT